MLEEIIRFPTERIKYVQLQVDSEEFYVICMSLYGHAFRPFYISI
jgi:hypothetical protein